MHAGNAHEQASGPSLPVCPFVILPHSWRMRIRCFSVQMDRCRQHFLALLWNMSAILHISATNSHPM